MFWGSSGYGSWDWAANGKALSLSISGLHSATCTRLSYSDRHGASYNTLTNHCSSSLCFNFGMSPGKWTNQNTSSILSSPVEALRWPSKRPGKLHRHRSLGDVGRYSEYFRELVMKSISTDQPYLTRRRYFELCRKRYQCGLDAIIMDICDNSEINRTEAISITFSEPGANGAQLKHIAQICRPKRKTNWNIQLRANRCSRRRAYDASVRALQESWWIAWGSDATRNVYTNIEKLLSGKSSMVLKDGQRQKERTNCSWGNRYTIFTEKSKSSLAVAFFSSTTVLTVYSWPGRAFVDAKVCARFTWHLFLLQSNRTIGYMLFILRVCYHSPIYLNKERAISSVQYVISLFGFTCQQNYCTTVHADILMRVIKRWARGVYAEREHGRPHWSPHNRVWARFIHIPHAT